MPEKWTGEISAMLHTNRIKQKDLAEEMGVTPEYISMILNGKKKPAKAKAKMVSAIKSIITKRDEIEEELFGSGGDA